MPKRFRAGATVWDFLPRVTVEQRNVPFHGGVKFRVMGGLRALKTAIRYGEVELRVPRHSTEYGGHVLNRMTANGEDAIGGLRQ